MKIIFNKNQGLTLVEVLVGVFLIAIIILSVAQVSFIALKALKDKDDKIKALSYAKEGMEIVRYLRDESWSLNIANLNLDTNYYFDNSSGKWSLTQTNPGLLEGKFKRFVVFKSVMRDSNDNIVSSGGLNDPKTRKVIVTVLWDDDKKNVSISAYITDLFNN